MKIAVLSANPELYSTQRVVEAARQRGHEVVLIDYLNCSMSVSSGRPRVTFMGRDMADIDAVVPRVAASKSLYGLAVVRQFEMMGIYAVNSSQAISRARDKLRCLQLLSRKGVGMPVTGFAHSTKDVEGLIDMVGGVPLIIKLLEGSQGIGVVLAETHQAARSVIEAFRGLDVNILVQEFIREADRSDIRAFVIGDKVVAAIRRQGKEGDFRSNLHRGGHAAPVKLTKEERSAAVRSAKALGLRIAGVDLLRSNRGPLVMEVNSSPGLEGIETATGKNVAGSLIEFVEKDILVRGAQTRVQA